MHLENKALLFLASPFIVAAGLWMASDLIMETFSTIFETAERTPTDLVEHEGETYRFITEHKDEYASLLDKINERTLNRPWISERIFTPASSALDPLSLSDADSLALKPPPPLISFTEGNLSAIAPLTWSVQMVLPDQNIAIINNTIYRVGQSQNGIKLLEVSASKIEIQTSKGKQWVKLFQ